MSLPRYDPSRTWDWNREHAPEPVQLDIPPVPGSWSFCGLAVDSPLGTAAGPLLNGKWVLYYASLGHSVLTYKTVRTAARDCYDLPNLAPVDAPSLTRAGDTLTAADQMRGSWAISFGMPSVSPDVWRADIEHTRDRMPKGTVLSVSVVGTERAGGSLDQLADDYALCARWAAESGAQVVEANFSCPNVCTADGQLDRDPAAAALVAERIDSAIGPTPLLLKIGHIPDSDAAARLLETVNPFVAGLSMTNCISATIRSRSGELLFGGEPRGIGGPAIRDASIAQVTLFRRLAAQRGLNLFLVGVGGAATADDVRAYLTAGADACHMATAAMTEPETALRIRHDFSRRTAVDHTRT
jgi:dihydroorotate dehydrogenase (NAD+) catalytic subunit